MLTSVTPNPLSVGTVTLTIQGTGFVSGALVYDSYGNNSMIQTQPNSVTSTSISVTIYQGPASTSTFCVENPGSVCSNSIVVPVGSAGSGGGSGTSSTGSSVPVLTSVTPNPLSVGTITLTIQGTGFQNGALVYDTYGSNSMIQTQPNSVTSTSISVTIYQGQASTSTFCVKNPGTACSNNIVVPVTASASSGGTSSGGTTSTSPSAPVLTSVTPNPLSVGTITVTIAGTGFQSGALVYDTYGSNSMIQTQPNSVTATSISVTIYQGPASTSTFCVKNPGSACSNNIVVPVTASTSSGGTGSGGSTPSNYTLTVVNGTIVNPAGNGQYAPGTVVSITANTPPTGQAFQSWTGAQVANVLAPSTTLTMPGENITVTANFYTPQPIPFPVTSHPRLWITQDDLPRLQSWATEGNVTWNGIGGPLGTAIGNYQAAFPGAALNAKNPTPASPYPDFGDTQGYTGMLSEENAFILAFQSLVNPSVSDRMQYAQAARNLLMYAMNQAALGHQQGAPFRDPAFALYNRASFTGHEWPLIVDWIYNAVDADGNPILTASDKATIRSVFMMWAGDCLTASTTGGDNPGTPGLVNSLALLPNNLPYRMASNNYFLAHARLLTLMSLALDPADDPPVNAGMPAAAIGNTLRSYITDATGAWLYEEFAMMGDPQVVAQAYNVPNNPTGAGFGLASGGLPPEGTLYGESFGYILQQLLALQTAGLNNVNYAGPQIAMIGAPVWDRYVQGYISSLTPTPMVPPTETYLGSIYQIEGYGDMLRLWETPDQMAPFALLALLDQEQGISTHVDAGRWFALNAMPGGASALLSRMVNPWTWGVTQDILYYMLLDPNAPAPTDPRPTFPTLFYDAPASRIVAHSDWTPAASVFSYRASWISINHQDGASGEFSLYRKGEWLTKEMSNYDNSGGGNGTSTTFHNTLSLQNWCAACANVTFQGVDLPTWIHGSQWMENENAGDPVNTMSSGPGYVFASSNLTNLYNNPHGEDYQLNGQWMVTGPIANITQATRSIVWLNNDYIVVYDRATSINPGLFKIFNMSLVTNPSITGNTATETMADGQQLFIQTLLPQNPTMSSFNGAATLEPIADTEPTQYIYQVQDATNPADTRFLHVIQGADPGAPMAAATYLQSIGGTNFDGAAFGTTAVYFPVSATQAFGGTTLPAPAGTTTVIVTGLAPNTGYSVSVQNNVVTVFPNGTNGTSDQAGVLTVTI